MRHVRPSSEVLIVESDPDLGSLLAELVDAAGFSPTLVGDAVAAVDALARGGIKIMIVDLDPLRADVMRLVQSLCRSGSGLHVVVLTGLLSARYRTLAEDCGARWILSKPVANETLLAAIAC